MEDPHDPDDALGRRDRLLRIFVAPDGRIERLPARRSKRLVVLDHLAQVFEPGERYPEAEVNRRLRAAHEDVAALRRHLVDEGFLSREDGVYRRSGGTITSTSSRPEGVSGCPGACRTATG